MARGEGIPVRSQRHRKRDMHKAHSRKGEQVSGERGLKAGAEGCLPENSAGYPRMQVGRLDQQRPEQALAPKITARLRRPSASAGPMFPRRYNFVRQARGPEEAI